MEAAWFVESLTNDRLRAETGNIGLVAIEDRISGPGASVVMAAFTHIGKASRFTNGTYGVYYAAHHIETAIRETVYHREQFLKLTQQEPLEICMRVYRGKILKPLHDVRGAVYENLHDPKDYIYSQQWAKQLRATGANGLVYRSVRHLGGECIAVFRPPTISIPEPSQHLYYVWNGERITHVKQSELVVSF